MSVSKLPNGRWRAQIAVDGKNLSVPSIIGGERSYRTKSEAKAARAKAREALGKSQASSVTVRGFWERWTTDPLFARPKESTNLHNRERTRGFAEKYGSVPLHRVDGRLVGEWLAGGKRNGTVPALRAMFYDALSAELIAANPFARRKIHKGRGNRDNTPPPESTVWALIGAAKKLTAPGFAAWLQVACFTGMRPGELDALRWDAVDLDGNRVEVREQFSASTRTFSLPKNGERRTAILTPHARAALLDAQAVNIEEARSEFCFVNARREHWTASARAYQWKAVKAAVGYEQTLYLCTRHFFGAYAVNVLKLDSEDVAIALGHKDGGQLVRLLYGHRSHEQALERVARAFEGRSNVRPLREADSA